MGGVLKIKNSIREFHESKTQTPESSYFWTRTRTQTIESRRIIGQSIKQDNQNF